MFLLDAQRRPWNQGACHIFYGEDQIARAMQLRGHLEDNEAPPHAVSSIECKVGSIQLDVVALLDTGAEFCVAGGMFAQLLLASLPSDIRYPTRTLASRYGRHEVVLAPLPVRLVNSASFGSNLDTEAPFLLSQDLPSWVVLGVSNFVSKLRLAFEPAQRPDQHDLLLFGKHEATLP